MQGRGPPCLSGGSAPGDWLIFSTNRLKTSNSQLFGRNCLDHPRNTVCGRWYVVCGAIALPQGRVRLAYSMIPVEGVIEREQYGETYRGPASAIVDASGRQVAKPDAPSQQLKEDYLLVTRLPGWAGVEGTSVLIFAGLHGPGTRSAELILTSIDPKELSYLADKIGLGSDRPTPYFQAVFRATSFCLKDGSHVAQKLVCMKENCPPVVLDVT